MTLPTSIKASSLLTYKPFAGTKPVATICCLNILGDAVSSFSQVAKGTTYTHQARYFQGLVAMKIARAGAGADPSHKGSSSANYKQAIEAFRVATELPPDTPEHKHVIDLAWMAVGRLFYEMEQYQQAGEALFARLGDAEL